MHSIKEYISNIYIIMINPYSQIAYLPKIKNPTLVKFESRKLFMYLIMRPFSG